MGLKDRKKGQGAPKSTVVLGAPARVGAGFSEQVVIVGRCAVDQPVVGEAVSLTLADDRPQLVAGGRKAAILECRPPLARVTQRLEQGESYLGTVTEVLPDRFEATLTRAG